MKLPYPMWTLNANATVFTSALNGDGEPVKTELFSGRVNYVKKTKQILNANRELIMLNGWVVIPGDISSIKSSHNVTFYVAVCGLDQRVMMVKSLTIVFYEK